MAKLEWDKTGSRYYETGTSHGVLYPQKPDGTYSKGVVWNGLTGVTENPSGAEETALYADDIKYASLRSAEEFGYTIEAYTYPEEFAECDGSAVISPGVYIGQQSRSPFGFSYRTVIGNDTASESDDGYKLHIIYNSTASPSEKAYSTINDSPDAITFSWECSTTPVPVEGYKPSATITIDSTKVEKTKLKKLEDKLYGTTSEEATLPSIDEVISILKASVMSVSAEGGRVSTVSKD